jgi:hypothetical protein
MPSAYLTKQRKEIGVPAFAFLTLGLLVVLWHSGDKTTALMWAGACLGLGSVFGFLFGIPRIRAQDTTPGAVLVREVPVPVQSPPLAPFELVSPPNPPENKPVTTSEPSNLEQVSDWMTKLLLGGGLTQLKDIPGAMTSWGYHIAVGIADKPENVKQFQVFGTALILYFLVLGFLAGFLITKIELSDQLR